MELVAPVLAGLADVAGFNADNLPNALRIAHVDVRIAVVASHRAIGVGGLNGASEVTTAVFP